MNSNKVSIGSALFPFYLTLGHELIHALHFFEDEKSYKYNLTTHNINLFYEEALALIFLKENAKSKNNRQEFLWGKTEEQRTVIGFLFKEDPNKPVGKDKKEKTLISELTLRMAEGFAPRYAYQNTNEFFFEKREILDFIIDKGKKDLKQLGVEEKEQKELIRFEFSENDIYKQYSIFE